MQALTTRYGESYVIPDYDYDCDVCEDTQEVDCLECEGSGMTDDGEICEYCGGAGTIDCPECM